VLRSWRRADLVAKIDAEVARKDPAKDRDWFVNRALLTFAVVRGAARFEMRSSDEAQPVRIGRSFALSTKEITQAQLARCPGAPPVVDDSVRDRPAQSVSWYVAARYCRWLSEKEEIPESQMCYPRLDQIKDGMELPADYLNRTGYRLPTEAEWEFGCGFGAKTRRHFGQDDLMLRYYAWTLYNSDMHTWTVGRLMPNDLGLFDVLGNVYEWCHPRAFEFVEGRPATPYEDVGVASVIRNGAELMLRGGSFDSRPVFVTTTFRNPNPPETADPPVGFRVARTCR
jgi:formylglycine-generating enzyme required for sulfatase activity